MGRRADDYFLIEYSIELTDILFEHLYRRFDFFKSSGATVIIATIVDLIIVAIIIVSIIIIANVFRITTSAATTSRGRSRASSCRTCGQIGGGDNMSVSWSTRSRIRSVQRTKSSSCTIKLSRQS